MSTRGNEPGGRVSEERLDALFDRELDEAGRERLFEDLRHDLRACEDLARTQRMIAMLRQGVAAPDQSAAILEGVRRRRAFLPPSLRRAVKAGRLGLAAAILLVALGAALAHRFAPDAVSLAPPARPVSEVVQSGRAAASTGVQELSAAVQHVATGVTDPVRQMLVAVEGGTARTGGMRLYGKLSPGEPAVRRLAPGSEEMVVITGSGADIRWTLPHAGVERGSLVIAPPRYVPGTDRSTAQWAGVCILDHMFMLPTARETPGVAGRDAPGGR